MTIDEIYDEINHCEKCELFKNRMAHCSYRGDPDSKVIIIGEAFGEDEQRVGKPFVGRCGRLLNLILAEMDIVPDKDVYITNIVKDRPPNNRVPLQHEILACQNYLIEEIREIKPRLIITLGRTSGLWWNKGEDFDWGVYNPENRWLPLYHPSYLLRRRDLIPKWKEALLKVW
jgi:uracil-DNA glycosylase